MTALSLQNQLPGAVCLEAAPGSPRGLRQSPALAAAKEKLQMSRVGHLLKAPVTAPAGPPGELGVGVSHLLPLRHQGSPAVERFQVVEKYEEFVVISSKSEADETSTEDSLALERGTAATLASQKKSVFGKALEYLYLPTAGLCCCMPIMAPKSRHNHDWLLGEQTVGFRSSFGKAWEDGVNVAGDMFGISPWP